METEHFNFNRRFMVVIRTPQAFFGALSRQRSAEGGFILLRFENISGLLRFKVGKERTSAIFTPSLLAARILSWVV